MTDIYIRNDKLEVEFYEVCLFIIMTLSICHMIKLFAVNPIQLKFILELAESCVWSQLEAISASFLQYDSTRK